MPNYCPNCGSELKFHEAEICPSCGVRIKEPPKASHPISRNVIIISYITTFFIPIIGIVLSFYYLIKGRVIHFIGLMILSIVMTFFWLGFFEGLN